MHISFLIPQSVRVFPLALGFVSLSPIKCQNVNQVCNFWPLAILAAFSKVLEKNVAQQLMKHVELNSCLHPLQFGFCQLYRGRCFVEQFKSSFDTGGVVGTVFLDLKRHLTHQIMIFL